MSVIRLERAKGSTSNIIPIYVYDSSSTVGAGLTGLVYNTSSLTAYYDKPGQADGATQISLVTMTKGTFTSSGFVATDGTNLPGHYQLCVPNAAFDTAGTLVIGLKGAANMVPVKVHIMVTETDANITAIKGKTDYLPSATAGAAGGVFIAGSNAATTANITGNITGNLSGSVGSVAGAVGSVTGNVGGNVTGSVGSVASGGITAASIATGAIDADALSTDASTEIAGAVADAVWDEAMVSHTTSGTIGEYLYNTSLDAGAVHTAVDDPTIGLYSISGDISNLATQIGPNGTNLSAIPWNAAWDAEVESECADAIAAGGLSQLTAQQVWEYATRALTEKTGFTLDGAYDAAMSAASQTSVDAIPTATENADELLKRDWSSVTGEASRSVLNALRAIRNKVSLSGATMTVTKENDSTAAWTAAVTTDADADPITSVDPA